MKRLGLLIAVGLLAIGATAHAEEAAAAAAAAPPSAALDDVNALWTCLAAFLVFFMQAGFALVETGLTRAKNAVNIIMKNLMDFVLGSIVFWAIGFGLMFGLSSGLIGTSGFFFDPNAIVEGGKTIAASKDWTVSFSWSFLIFQTVFAATAATIVSGAMAERTKFVSYLIYTVVISGLVYPVFGSWAWGGLFLGGGWLEGAKGGFLESHGLPGFIDFAGSTVVHSHWWLGGAGRRPRPGAAPRPVQGQQGQPDPGPQLAAGRPGRVHSVAGLVRVQPG